MVAVGDALQRITASIYLELRAMLNRLQHQDPELRTTEMRNFIAISRIRLYQLSIITQWLAIPGNVNTFRGISMYNRNINDIELSINRQLDEIFYAQASLYSMRTRQLDVTTGYDMIMGNRNQLPYSIFSCGMPFFPNKLNELTILKDLEIIMKLKIILNDPIPYRKFPLAMTSIEQGVLCIKYAKLFELNLTLKYLSIDAEWNILSSKILITNHTNEKYKVSIQTINIGNDLLKLLRTIATTPSMLNKNQILEIIINCSRQISIYSGIQLIQSQLNEALSKEWRGSIAVQYSETIDHFILIIECWKSEFSKLFQFGIQISLPRLKHNLLQMNKIQLDLVIIHENPVEPTVMRAHQHMVVEETTSSSNEPIDIFPMEMIPESLDHRYAIVRRSDGSSKLIKNTFHGVNGICSSGHHSEASVNPMDYTSSIDSDYIVNGVQSSQLLNDFIKILTVYKLNLLSKRIFATEYSNDFQKIVSKYFRIEFRNNGISIICQSISEGITTVPQDWLVKIHIQVDFVTGIFKMNPCNLTDFMSGGLADREFRLFMDEINNIQSEKVFMDYLSKEAIDDQEDVLQHGQSLPLGNETIKISAAIPPLETLELMLMQLLLGYYALDMQSMITMSNMKSLRDVQTVKQLVGSYLRDTYHGKPQIPEVMTISEQSSVTSGMDSTLGGDNSRMDHRFFIYPIQIWNDLDGLTHNLHSLYSVSFPDSLSMEVINRLLGDVDDSSTIKKRKRESFENGQDDIVRSQLPTNQISTPAPVNNEPKKEFRMKTKGKSVIKKLAVAAPTIHPYTGKKLNGSVVAKPSPSEIIRVVMNPNSMVHMNNVQKSKKEADVITQYGAYLIVYLTLDFSFSFHCVMISTNCSSNQPWDEQHLEAILQGMDYNNHYKLVKSKELMYSYDVLNSEQKISFGDVSKRLISESLQWCEEELFTLPSHIDTSNLSSINLIKMDLDINYYKPYQAEAVIHSSHHWTVYHSDGHNGYFVFTITFPGLNHSNSATDQHLLPVFAHQLVNESNPFIVSIIGILIDVPIPIALMTSSSSSSKKEMKCTKYIINSFWHLNMLPSQSSSSPSLQKLCCTKFHYHHGLSSAALNIHSQVLSYCETKFEILLYKILEMILKSKPMKEVSIDAFLQQSIIAFRPFLEFFRVIVAAIVDELDYYLIIPIEIIDKRIQDSISIFILCSLHSIRKDSVNRLDGLDSSELIGYIEIGIMNCRDKDSSKEFGIVIRPLGSVEQKEMLLMFEHGIGNDYEKFCAEKLLLLIKSLK